MRTIAILAATALTALTATIGMAREPEQRFTYEGKTYTYTSTTAAGGRQIIEGHRLSDNTRFRLIVRGDRVTGMSGNTPVSFNIAEARGASGVVELAAN
jgi:hypothetical protein